MKIDRPPKPERELSLIERADALWGFDGLRPQAEASPDAEPFAPLRPELVRAPAKPAEPDGVEEQPLLRPVVGRERTSHSLRAGLVDAPNPFTAAEPVRTEEAVAPAFLHTDPEPFELTEPALPEWAAPTGVAAIDRVMLAQKGMLVPGAPVGALAEEFRLIKRQLLLNAREVADGPLGQRARTILVGSGKPGDGKTYCAINLAISLAAERDVEILLVDGDFAKPDVMKTLGVEDSVGFMDILADPSLDPESCIVRTDVPQLSLLPSGQRTTSDTELLASRRTEEVIDALLAANPKRMIVFDTPPALAASPASVLALLIGQVMLVVRADRTTEADVREAVGLLGGCERISLVLNAVSYQPGGGRFGSYYGQEKSR